MQQREIPQNIQFAPPPLTPAVKVFVIATLATYILQKISLNTLPIFGLYAPSAFGERAYWQFLTYMFMHGSFTHFFFNMMSLWMFGGEVERVFGTQRFAWFYLGTGVGAGLFTSVFSNHTVIGASGAIFGIFVAYGLLFPNKETLFLFFIRMKAMYLVIILCALEILLEWSEQGDGVSHITHLFGGFIGLVVVVAMFKSREIKSFFRGRPSLRVVRPVQRQPETGGTEELPAEEPPQAPKNPTIH